MGSDLVYRHSGRLDTTRLAAATFFLAAAGGGTGLASGGVSGVILRSGKAGFLGIVGTLFLSIGVVFAVAWALSQALRWAKVRNLAAAVVSSAAVCLLTWYVTWCARSLVLAGSGFRPRVLANLLFHPGVVWDVLRTFAREQSQTGRSFADFGAWAWVFMGLEAALFFIIGTIGAAGACSKPYCEGCDHWARERLLRLTARNAREIRERLEAGEVAVLAELPAATPDSVEWLDVALFECPTCQAFSAVTVAGTKEPERQLSLTSVFPLRWSVENLLIDGALAAQLRAKAYVPWPPRGWTDQG